MDDGGPAYPQCPAKNAAGDDYFPAMIDPYGSGISVLDVFACVAEKELVRAHVEQIVDDLSRDIVAHESYLYAQAMLAEKRRLEKEHDSRGHDQGANATEGAPA